jgi:hypothetical protein
MAADPLETITQLLHSLNGDDLRYVIEQIIPRELDRVRVSKIEKKIRKLKPGQWTWSSIPDAPPSALEMVEEGKLRKLRTRLYFAVETRDGVNFTSLKFTEPCEDDQNDLVYSGLDFDVGAVTTSYLKRQCKISATDISTVRSKWQEYDDIWWCLGTLDIYIFYQPSVHDPDAGGIRHYYDPADGRIHAFTNSVDGLCHRVSDQLIIPKEDIPTRGLLFIPFLYGDNYDAGEVFDLDHEK